MDQIILSDKNRFPAEEVIYSQIGKSKKIWDEFFQYIRSKHPEFSEQWRYYNDGKSWLMKVVKKSKTIFWLSVIKNGFRITFFFTDKAEQLIKESSLSEEIKEGFKNGKRFGKIRPVTLVMQNEKNLKFAKELISIKLKFK